MLKKIYRYTLIISFIFTCLTFIKIDNRTINLIKKNTQKITHSTSSLFINNNLQSNKKDDDQIGKIIIEKLNINKPLYNIYSDKNNIEKNITILKESIFPDKENSIIFIAAHSGTGPIAFFKDLNKLIENDEIIIEYNNINYKYIVKDYWEVKKNGYINVNKERKNQLILTTCSPNKDNYQLIINCIQKES